MVLNRETAKRRVERYLKTINQGLRISKSIVDKSKHGEAYIIDLDSKKVIRDKTSIIELMNEFGLILEGEEIGF